MNGDEVEFSGGIDTCFDGERIFAYLTESGPGINEAAGESMTLELKFSTGATVINLVGILPKELEDFAEWLAKEANRIIKREEWHE